LRRIVGYLYAGTPTAYTGIVHEDVEPTEPSSEFIDELAHSGCFTQVDSEEQGLAAKILRFGGDLGAFFPIAAHKGNLTTFPDKAVNYASADA
jgi:hypothetical protein